MKNAIRTGLLVMATVAPTLSYAQLSDADYEKYRAMNSAALQSVLNGLDHAKKCLQKTATRAEKQTSLSSALKEYDTATRLFTEVMRNVPPRYERVYVIAEDNLRGMPDKRKYAQSFCE